jgi:Flp pilus assembly protein TadD
MNLGAAERGCGHGAAALQAYRDAVAADGTNIEARYWVGILATREGRTGEAVEAFDSILSVQPRNVAALTGKARALRNDGHPAEAMELVDQALALDPEDDEARVLKGQLLAGQGREEEARDVYKSVLSHRPGDADALASLETIGPERYWSASVFHDRADVVEGLDEENLLVGHELITPTRIAYIVEGARTDVRLPVTDRSALVAGVSERHEETRNLDGDFAIYDYDVLSAQAGFDHRLRDPWTFSWRVGASRFTPRDDTSVDTETKGLALVSLKRAGEQSLLRFTLSRAPFIWRGFAGNRQFRVFDHDQGLVEWNWRFAGGGGGWRLETSAAANHYDDGNQPTSVAAGFGWERGDRRIFLRASHDPFPARFLDEKNELDFVDYDSVVLFGRTPLLWGFRVYGEATAGRFRDEHILVEEPKLVDTDGDGTKDTTLTALVDGPFEDTDRQAFDATLAWSPPAWKPFSVGAQYVYDRYDFDSASYNTNNIHGWWGIVEIVDEPPDRRIGYAIRYARGFLHDERDGDYGANDLSGRLGFRLSAPGRAAGPIRLDLEARWGDDTLRDDLYDQETRHARIYLIIPF